MNTLVVYHSKTGHTESYAMLLGETLNCRVIENKKFNRTIAKDYNQVVYLGWIMATKIVGLNGFLKKVDEDNQILVGAVGASLKSADYTSKIINANFESQPSYPLFYLQGGFDPEKLSFPMKFMLGRVADAIKKKQVKAPETLTDEDKEFLNFFQVKHSDVSHENLEDILSYLEL